MQVFKRMTLLIFIWMLCISVLFVTYAQANTNSIQTIQKELEQKEQEKQTVNKEMDEVQKEIDSLNSYISKNKKAMESTQDRIDATNILIEQKKEEIVVLEDNILGRKEVMKKRVVALQNDSNLSFMVNVLIESKSIADLIDRASAVSTIINADKNILGTLQEDLAKIEDDKKEIDKQQQILAGEQMILDQQQQELDQNLQKRHETLSAIQAKYNQIDKEMSGFESQIKAAQEQIRKEQDGVRVRTVANNSPNPSEPAGKGVELYVTATAYSPEESGTYTSLGYNIKENPNMKLIAVDPSVIPLGSRVWVEGYGEAIAGDVGSAIRGHKIDVLMPTKAAALSWGRRTVKIIILN